MLIDADCRSRSELGGVPARPIAAARAGRDALIEGSSLAGAAGSAGRSTATAEAARPPSAAQRLRPGQRRRSRAKPARLTQPRARCRHQQTFRCDRRRRRRSGAAVGSPPVLDSSVSTGVAEGAAAGTARRCSWPVWSSRRRRWCRRVLIPQHDDLGLAVRVRVRVDGRVAPARSLVNRRPSGATELHLVGARRQAVEGEPAGSRGHGATRTCPAESAGAP